jgi:predicted amidophosphoribosyltransferase
MFCPNCGTSNDDTASFCSKCGGAVSSPVAASVPKQVFCPNCGTANDGTSSFCSNCGKPVAQPPVAQPPVAQPPVAQPPAAETPAVETPVAAPAPSQVFCPDCGTSNDDTTSFCSNCGEPMAGTPVAPPSPRQIFCPNCGTANDAGRRYAAAAGRNSCHRVAATTRESIDKAGSQVDRFRDVGSPLNPRFGFLRNQRRVGRDLTTRLPGDTDCAGGSPSEGRPDHRQESAKHSRRHVRDRRERRVCT